MGKWKNIVIAVEQSDGKIFEIERPSRRDGMVCIEGKWILPEQKDGKPYLFVKIETPIEAQQRRINERKNHVKLSAAMIPFMMVGAGLFNERRR